MIPGGHLNQWNHHQKIQKCEKCSTKKTVKRTLVEGTGEETRGQSIPWFTPAGNTCEQLKCFACFAQFMCEGSQITGGVNLGVTKKFQQVGKFANTESVNKGLAVFVCVLWAKWQAKQNQSPEFGDLCLRADLDLLPSGGTHHAFISSGSYQPALDVILQLCFSFFLVHWILVGGRSQVEYIVTSLQG